MRGQGVNEEVRRRHAWLELLQTSGPFLTLPVVDRVFPNFPNGIPQAGKDQRAAIRALVAQMLDDRGASRHSVIEALLRDVLGWSQHLLIDDAVPATLSHLVMDHGITLRPDFGYFDDSDDATEEDAEADDAVSDSDADDEDDSGGDDEDGGSKDNSAPGTGSGPWKLLGMVTAWGTHPLTRTTTGTWTANAVERLAILLRARDVPAGIVTDGRWWALVTAPRGGATGAAVWDASLFGEEPASFQALVALLHVSRFQAAEPKNMLPALFAESLQRQEEVTEQLGRQVREAVELLVTTLDSLDREADGALLAGVSDDDFYAGVVTLMMRVVFLLFAEERRLLPSDDDLYVNSYSVSYLVEQLEQADSLGAVLQNRTQAWHRLLAVSRAIHSGVQHEDLRLPAYGGGLFDPDRYPWLEGRPNRETSAAAARPPLVDDRIVLRMLKAVQYVVIGGERRRLTFRALDVEQIGYVYEGLLELEVNTATEPVLGLARPSKWPQKLKADAEVTITEARALQPKDFADRTGWAAKKAQAAWQSQPDPKRLDALARQHPSLPENPGSSLATLVAPYVNLLRLDEQDRPVVFPAGSRYITSSHRRAATGTHYTPKPLSKEVAEGALQPLVYRPGPLETSDETAWRIRPSSEIVKLKVADIAVGSGAFLVAACLYLAERLIEAWLDEGDAEALTADLHRATGRIGVDAEVDLLQLRARRAITEHCLYGVDINPLAVEMAKLSLWLVTMDRERPFGFLDDRLAAGDSLLGLVSVEQLETLHVDAREGRRLHQNSLDFAEKWRSKLAEAADLRRQITIAPAVTIRDIEYKARKLAQAEKLSGELTQVANAITAAGLANAKLKGKKLDGAFLDLYVKVSNESSLDDHIEKYLQQPRPEGTVERTPFQWPLVFPEIFADTTSPGFDAIIGNPPFLGGSKISSTMGDDYLAWLHRWDGNDVSGAADLATRFILRADRLLSRRGQLAYVTTKTVVEGAPLRVGLQQVTESRLTIRSARSPHPWPTTSASLQIIEFWGTHARLAKGVTCWLDGEEVPALGPDLVPYGRVKGRPRHLSENADIAFKGSMVQGLGFILTEEQKDGLTARNSRNQEVIQPYVVGKDLNQRPDCSGSRWIINFRDWPLERAEEYPDCMDVLQRLVKPERDRNKRIHRRENWWLFGEYAPGLYRAIRELDHALAICLHGNLIMPARVSARNTFSHATTVFALEDLTSLAILSSSIHSTWAIRYSGTIRTDLRYAASEVFLTLPRPQPTSELEALGRQLDETRRELMLSRSWGLTKTYNRVHDPDNHEPAIVELRDIHVAIDEAVMRAYGWEDLDLKIGHHPTKIGIRWTVSKEARFELLDRLLEENHKRYALEQGQ